MLDDERDVAHIRERVRARMRRPRGPVRLAIFVIMIVVILSIIGNIANLVSAAGSSANWNSVPIVGVFVAAMIVAGILRRFGRSRPGTPDDEAIQRAVRRAMRRERRRMALRNRFEADESRYLDDEDDYDDEEDEIYEKPKRHLENPPEKRKRDAQVHLGNDGELIDDDEPPEEDDSAEPPRHMSQNDQ